MSFDYSDPKNPTFNIAADTLNGALANDALHQDINDDVGVTIAVLSVADDGTTCTVEFAADLPTGERAAFEALVAAHDGVPLELPDLVSIDGPKDSDGSLIQNVKHTKTGWHYEPRSLDFVTSKYLSLYNRKHDGFTIAGGTDYGDGYLKFYDAAGAELSFQQTGHESEDVNTFQARLDVGCVVTVMDWQPTYDMDIIGGILMIRDAPAVDTYMWTIVAPDIPEGMGGQVPHVAGGWNLSFFNSKDKIIVNGRGSKTVVYDPVFNSNKFRTAVKHAAGAKIGLQMIYEHFKG